MNNGSPSSPAADPQRLADEALMAHVEDAAVTAVNLVARHAPPWISKDPQRLGQCLIAGLARALASTLASLGAGPEAAERVADDVVRAHGAIRERMTLAARMPHQ